MALLTGGIVGWSGSINEIPQNWQLCDGTNGTPDLRNRFVIGAGNNYTADQTGGFSDITLLSHTHTMSGTATSITNPHTHNFSVRQITANTGFNYRGRGYASSNIALTAAGAHSHSVTLSESGSYNALNLNLPPYYALAFIMEVS